VTPLTGKDRRFLRSLGHNLDPVVQLGKLGLTDGVVGAADIALSTHELIKLKLGTECPETPDDVGAALAPRLKADLVQVLGRTVLLFRPNPLKPKIALPGRELKKPANQAKSKPQRGRKPAKATRETPEREPSTRERPARGTARSSVRRSRG
jgi:RNA-binding protein